MTKKTNHDVDESITVSTTKIVFQKEVAKTVPREMYIRSTVNLQIVFCFGLEYELSYLILPYVVYIVNKMNCP